MRHSEYLHNMMMRKRGIGDVDLNPNDYILSSGPGYPLIEVLPGAPIPSGPYYGVFPGTGPGTFLELGQGNEGQGPSNIPTASIPADVITAWNTGQPNVAAFTADAAAQQAAGNYIVASSIPIAANPLTSTQVTQQAVQTSSGGSGGMNFSFQPSGYAVGDTWTMQISGATPNSPVSISASQNGTALGTTPFGNTDANGNWSLSGTFDSTTIGSWVETVMIGGASVGTVSFTISQAVATSSTNTQNPTQSSTNTTNSSTSTPTLPFYEDWGGISIMGFNVPIMLLVGGAAVLLFMFMDERGRR